ncbi:Uncharacterized protein TCM_034203 [Theobroma cacao]|uniref:Uncharacterized protein n=1 Tax=Theobroma cacao TaxID=3641 RepID=A0A061FE38_THECC|nr:Uncharacterized protein TCM_034203 [Theobroma cacao]
MKETINVMFREMVYLHNCTIYRMGLFAFHSREQHSFGRGSKPGWMICCLGQGERGRPNHADLEVSRNLE